MDSVPQQAAVIRDGDPSQSCPSKGEVKMDTTETVNAKEDKGKKATKATDKKKSMPGAHKRDASNAKRKNKNKSKKSRTKDESSSGNSSDSTHEEVETSGSSSEDSEDEAVPVRKRAVKKAPGTQKSMLKSSMKKSQSSKSQPANDSESSLDSSDTDSSSEEEEDVSGEGDQPDSKTTGSKVPKDQTPNQDLSYAVALQLQRLLQLAATQPPPPAPYTSHPGFSAGPGAHVNTGLGRGFSSLDYQNYLQPSRPALGGLPDLSSGRGLPGSQAKTIIDAAAANSGKKPKEPKKPKKPKKPDYKRVDQVWDNTIHNFKLQDTAESSSETKYDSFCFHIRRTFDWEGKYKATVVDIKSKLLRECLQDVIGNIKGVSLVDETPKLDPNVLFLYLKDLRKYARGLKKQVSHPPGSNKQERKKEAKRLEEKRQHLRILIKYIDKDYDHVKKSLYPMLEHGLITFDLLWALWKPDTLIYTTTYGSQDEPRIFKVDTAEKHYNISKGEFFYVEGKYFEYDGKQFGYGRISEEIGEFRGAKKITSLSCYPLKYRKDEEKLRAELIERGKKFATLGGAHFKSHHGMAYYKKKKSIIKVNVNGRVMVDPSIHRRINPNYPISVVRPKENDNFSDYEDSDDEDGCDSGSEDDEPGQDNELEDGEKKSKYVVKFLEDDKGRRKAVRMLREEAEEMDKEKLVNMETLDDVDLETSDDEDEDASKNDGSKVPEFTDEEYLIASPVVLGFAFGEKLWLEFTVSGIKEISWNEKAFESLVLEPKTKETVKALVESHKYHAAASIDDVIQGKGKGLVAVLHGPPGTGKTLTAESISELLKCPLYMVSAGELGTDSRVLEGELQRILDICHAWGAILLLDEADIVMEKRNMHDIHRNALVSIFLRQLEYFQGILFLTTNRVETFDDAFQSRIHIALRYDPLDLRAKKTVFKMFVERAHAQQKDKDNSISFTDDDYTSLARHDLNGRQIKNTVIRAQALAVNKGETLAMMHVRQILDVQVSFDRDLKGGTGYQDAMRSYF